MRLSLPLFPLALVACLSFTACKKETVSESTPSAGGPAASDGAAPAPTPAPAKAGPSHAKVKADLLKVMSAVFESDMETIATFTHPKVFELVGGQEQFLEQIGTVFDQTKAAGVRFGGAEVGNDIDYFTGTENEFLLVSTKLTIEAGGQSNVTAGHQLGVKKKGQDGWKYIDCSALNTGMARRWFPDFPEGREIPKPAVIPTTRPPEPQP